MASTPSALLLLELMANGENDNTWGTKANTVFSLLENAIAKRQPITLGGVDVTLSDTQFADNQARSLCLALTGTLTANVNLIVPSRSKMYLVDNGTTGAFTVTVKTSAGTGILAPQGAVTAIYSNGTNVVGVAASSVGAVPEAVNAQNLGNVAAANYARKDAFNQHSKGFATTFVSLTDAATVALDASLSNAFILTIGGNRTLSITNPANGQTIELWVVQDSTGSRTLAFPANVHFEGGTVPALSGAPLSLDRFRLTYNQARDEWGAEFIPAVSGGATIGLVLAANEQDVRLFERLGSPGGVVTVNLTLQKGFIISASSAITPALDLSGFASGSTINFTNFGLVAGKGGRGGKGGWGTGLDADDRWFAPGGNGHAGGNAILGPGTGRTFNITNGAGFIWGGGGGGGGGGISVDSAGTNAAAAGGGGGAGAGAEVGGDGGTTHTATIAANGADSGTGLNGDFGAGGAGAQTGNGSGGAGGAGGTWGAAGSAGAAPTTFTDDIAAGAAGAAGKAIELSGGSANFISGNGSPNVKGAVS